MTVSSSVTGPHFRVLCRYSFQTNSCHYGTSGDPWGTDVEMKELKRDSDQEVELRLSIISRLLVREKTNSIGLTQTTKDKVCS